MPRHSRRYREGGEQCTNCSRPHQELHIMGGSRCSHSVICGSIGSGALQRTLPPGRAGPRTHHRPRSRTLTTLSVICPVVGLILERVVAVERLGGVADADVAHRGTVVTSAGSVRNEPGGLNSSVVPSASPAASPSRQPRNRSRSAAPLKRRRPETVRPSCARKHAAVRFVASAGGGTSIPFPATVPRSGPEPRLRSCHGARASSRPRCRSCRCRPNNAHRRSCRHPTPSRWRRVPAVCCAPRGTPILTMEWRSCTNSVPSRLASCAAIPA